MFPELPAAGQAETGRNGYADAFAVPSTYLFGPLMKRINDTSPVTDEARW